MNHDSVDFLIVGLGLAGGLLAWELTRRDADVRVVDNSHRESASLAAAGLVTPVTGKRLVLQNSAEALLLDVKARYTDLAQRLGRKFFYPVPLLRLFADEDQRGYFERRRKDPAYAEFVGPLAVTDELTAFHAPHGGAWFQQTGYLDTSALIEALRCWLADTDRLHQAPLDHADLKIGVDGIRYAKIRAKRVVFCEGYGAMRNPWFRHLPWQAAKGEILHLRLESPAILPDALINWGKWLAPRHDGSYRLGATHGWSPLNCDATASGRNELLRSLYTRIPGVEIRVLDQVAAVRPATRDRRPFVGDHPAEPALSILNGFGAKGSLLIPWYARQMADHLCHGATLPPDSNITRHGP